MSAIRLAFEIVAASPEEERLQRLWLRHIERDGTLGALMQASFQCEACSMDDAQLIELQVESGDKIKAADLKALYR